MRRLVPLVLLLVACGSSAGPCTEIGCDNQVTVSYGTVVNEPYDLSVVGQGQTLTARCNDPDALETEQNPDNLSCNAGGFLLDGGPLSDSSAVFVTVVTVEAGDAILANAEVILSVVGEIAPNGPDCDPICTERSGTATLSP